MSDKNPMSDDEDALGKPPGDEEGEHYRPVSNPRSGKSGAGFIWFACADSSRDRILQLANLRDLEPGDIKGPRAWLHFSGMDVVLEGTAVRQVVYRIFLGRGSCVHEIRPGQVPIDPSAGVIERIRFLVPPPGGDTARKPDTTGAAKL